jgi:hypothetical protein
MQPCVFFGMFYVLPNIHKRVSSFDISVYSKFKGEIQWAKISIRLIVQNHVKWSKMLAMRMFKMIFKCPWWKIFTNDVKITHAQCQTTCYFLSFKLFNMCKWHHASFDFWWILIKKTPIFTFLFFMYIWSCFALFCQNMVGQFFHTCE